MERVYLDSVVFIYLVEQRQPWFSPIQIRLTATPVRVVVSDLTRMECRVKPVATGNSALLNDFDGAFAVAELAVINTAVFDEATQIRATHGFKTPDSIHLAAAVTAGCDVFLTNDHQLTKYTGIRVEVI
ncbi:MAG: PIN domain-containing protein [Gemmataceae bacterium]|nr:PIN domain-containing protein [Gemmataceae bacterium]